MRPSCIRMRIGDNSLYRWALGNGRQTLELDVPGSMSANESDTFVDAALNGVGLAYCLERRVADEIAAGRLEVVLPKWAVAGPPMVMYYPSRRQTLPGLQGVGRRGQLAGCSFNLGPSVLLRVGGVQVVVITNRHQCHEPMFLEMFGIDIAAARTVVVKSRGHFRAAFDEFFAPEQIFSVDAPGLTSPVLSRFDFRRLPRPVVPLDAMTEWTPHIRLLS